jgi:hypothetical protein
MPVREQFMKNPVPKYVTQARASLMLGITETELSRISKESGLGRVERAGNQEETYFTYEELQRICIVATNQVQAAPPNRMQDSQVESTST